MLNWKYTKSLPTKSLIDDFETHTNFKLPDEFRNIIQQYNGGRPDKRRFDTTNAKERCIKTFLSFNPEDKENVWFAWNRALAGMVPFAVDNFGNYIAFDEYAKPNSVIIVFCNHETGKIEFVANDFSEFINKLY